MLRTKNLAAFLSVVPLTLLAVACAPADGSGVDVSNQDVVASSASDAGTSSAGTPLPDSVHWFRNSAEQRAAYLQAFRLAARNVDAALGAATPPTPGTWAVISDADETLLDNSQYQKDRTALGWSADSWSAWVQSKRSTATPGSLAYVKHVRDLGGHVFVVTNGAQADCPAYTSHLQELGFQLDGVLCQTDSSDKNPRFQKVQDGTAVAGIGPQQVVQWTGDNINDFPNESQASRTDESLLADFGSKYVVLPNPMYGSWTSNPRQ